MKNTRNGTLEMKYAQIYQLNSACFLLICSKCCSIATIEFVLFFDEYFFARFLGGNGGSFCVEKPVWNTLPFTSSLRSACPVTCNDVDSKSFTLFPFSHTDLTSKTNVVYIIATFTLFQ